MALTVGKGPVTSSYTDSICILLSALSVSSRAALIFTLLLIKVATITVVKTVTLTIKAVAKEVIDIMQAVFITNLCMPRLCGVLVYTLTGSLSLPVIFPQTTVCTANVHTLPLVGTSVQVVVVWLVVVGQLPQFDARML